MIKQRVRGLWMWAGHVVVGNENNEQQGNKVAVTACNLHSFYFFCFGRRGEDPKMLTTTRWIVAFESQHLSKCLLCLSDWTLMRSLINPLQINRPDLGVFWGVRALTVLLIASSNMAIHILRNIFHLKREKEGVPLKWMNVIFVMFCISVTCSRLIIMSLGNYPTREMKSWNHRMRIEGRKKKSPANCV